MYAKRVEVLHACHSEAVVIRIAYNLELNLFPTFERLLYQYLVRECERTLGKFLETLFITAYTAAQAAESVGRTHHDRETNLMSGSKCIFHALYSLTHRCLHRYLIEFLNKEVAVLGIHDSLYRGTENLYTIFLKNTLLVEFCTAVERSLSAKSKQNAIGTLFLYYLLDIMYINRQEIHLVRYTLRGLDSCDIRIYQH